MHLHRLFLAALACLAIALPLAAVPAAAASSAAPERCPRLTGLFLQPLALHRDWSAADWTGFFDELAAMQVEVLVLQWTALDSFTVLEPPAAGTDGLPEGLPASLLQRILEGAAAQGMKVRLGLVHDPDYWNRIGRDPAQVQVYLRRHRLASAALAERLVQAAAGHPAFAGWYLPEEIDEITWQPPEKRALLQAHLRETAAMLHDLPGPQSIAISGFTGGRQEPAALAAFWQEVLAGSGIDLLMLQDGFGVQPMLASDLGLYLSALEGAAAAAGAELAVIPELFVQTGGPPLDEGAFDATPAPLERILVQLRAVPPALSQRVGFSAEYITSAAGRPAALSLQRQYLSWLRDGCR